MPRGSQQQLSKCHVVKVKEKQCKDCLKTLGVEEFYRNRRICKICLSKRYDDRSIVYRPRKTKKLVA